MSDTFTGSPPSPLTPAVSSVRHVLQCQTRSLAFPLTPAASSVRHVHWLPPLTLAVSSVRHVHWLRPLLWLRPLHWLSPVSDTLTGFPPYTGCLQCQTHSLASDLHWLSPVSDTFADLIRLVPPGLTLCTRQEDLLRRSMIRLMLG